MIRHFKSVKTESFHVIRNSYYMNRSAWMRRGAYMVNVATQPHLAQDSVKTESILIAPTVL